MSETTGRPAAFFDVDDTLLAVKTMLSFWEHWRSTAHGRANDTHYQDVLALVRAGVPRQDCNRAYYRLFTGVDTAEFEHAVHQWYRDFRGRPLIAAREVLRELRNHQRRGNLIALVSGSSTHLLSPFAKDIGADVLLCTQQLAAAGRLTGEVVEPMIGHAKLRALTRTLADRSLDPASCYAYGDDPSDLPLLAAVGHPAVVGDDPTLAGHAARAGWRRLPLAPGPLAPVAPVRGELSAAL